MSRHTTLKQFRYFLAVSETASVAAAARMINIAQSAVTKSVQELEDSLGVKLFMRSSRGMVLTQEGHRFQASARKVIAAVAEAGQLMGSRAETLIGNLTIGVTSLSSAWQSAPPTRRSCWRLTASRACSTPCGRRTRCTPKF